MQIIVLAKLVPDLVEELIIDDRGTALDPAWLRFKLNEFDDHAIEQAMLLKESSGAQVTVMVPDMEGADDVLYTAAARGSDRMVKMRGEFEQLVNNHALARALAAVLHAQLPDLVLTGVQAHNDLDGALGPLLAGYLDLPYVGYVSGVRIEAGHVTVRKEYPAGLIAEMEVVLPAVLGIQSAGRPPGYVAFSKIRQAMKTTAIEELPAPEMDPSGGPLVERMYLPESGERATMIVGTVDEVTARLLAIFQEQGVL